MATPCNTHQPEMYPLHLGRIGLTATIQSLTNKLLYVHGIGGVEPQSCPLGTRLQIKDATHFGLRWPDDVKI